MKFKVSELLGRDLDAAVAICEGIPFRGGNYARDEDVENLKVPFNLFTIEGGQVEEVRVLRYGVPRHMLGARPSIDFVDFNGDKAWSTVDWVLLDLSEAEIEQAAEVLGIAADFYPSKSWDHGGPIIEREGIASRKYRAPERWYAYRKKYHHMPMSCEVSSKEHCEGPTLLIAAMRCYVADKLGEEIEIPDEFLKTMQRGKK